MRYRSPLDRDRPFVDHRRVLEQWPRAVDPATTVDVPLLDTFAGGREARRTIGQIREHGDDRSSNDREHDTVRARRGSATTQPPYSASGALHVAESHKQHVRTS